MSNNKEEKSTISFITGNKHKYQEVLKCFQKENLNYVLNQLNIKTNEIQANTLEEVALFKLNSVKNQVEGSFFIEDAGFFVDVPLNGFPGVYSSYVFKTIGNEGILKLAKSQNSSIAHFGAVIAYFHEPLDKILIFKGIVKGSISKTIRGENGFGFDPIFIPDTLENKTFAEITTAEKNALSHRGKALNQLIEFLKKN